MTALCHNHEDPELWFHGSKHATARAKAICGRCPVRAGCLAHALEHKIGHGVWGALTPTERHRLTHPRKPSVRSALPVPEPSAVRGVSWNAHKGCWAVVIRHGRRSHWVGQFADQGAAEAAAIAKCAELDTSPRRWSSRTA